MVIIDLPVFEQKRIDDLPGVFQNVWFQVFIFLVLFLSFVFLLVFRVVFGVCVCLFVCLFVFVGCFFGGLVLFGFLDLFTASFLPIFPWPL